MFAIAGKGGSASSWKPQAGETLYCEDANPFKKMQNAALEAITPLLNPPTEIPPLPAESRIVQQAYGDAPAGVPQAELPPGTRGLAHGVMLPPKIVHEKHYVTGHTGDWGKGTDDARDRQESFVQRFIENNGHRFKILGDIIYPVVPTDPRHEELRSQVSSVIAALEGTGADVTELAGNHDWGTLQNYFAKPERIKAMMDHANEDPYLVMPARYYAQEVHLEGGKGKKILEVYIDNEFLHQDPRQLQWLDGVLANHNCDQVIVHGHRPIVTGSYHGKNEELERHLAPRLNAGKNVVSYEAAHDHVGDESRSRLLKPVQAVNGLAGESREYAPTRLTKFGTNVPSMRMVAYDGTNQHVRWLSKDGEELYRATYQPDKRGFVQKLAAGSQAAMQAPWKSAPQRRAA